MVFLLFTSTINAQYYFFDDTYYDNRFVFEVGVSLGGMNCLTDLGGRKGVGKKFLKDVTLKTTQACGGVYFNGIYQNAVALRVEGTYGTVTAYDSILKKDGPSTYGRYERNLSFRSTIFELMIAGEFHPLIIFGSFDAEKTPSRASPYLLAGIGYFGFNPEARLNKTWVNLRPLHLEGQGFGEYPDRPNYKIRQVNIPLGAGIKYELSSILNLRFEFVYRILNTDYLDDVSLSQYIDKDVFYNHLSGAKLSNALLLYDRRNELNPGVHPNEQRGNPSKNDAYYSLNLKLGIMVGRERIRGRAAR